MRNRVFIAVFVFVFAANAPMWIASRLLGLTVRGLFGIEFLLIGILSVFLGPALTVAFFLATILVDLVRAIGMTYMLSISDLLGSSLNVLEFAPSHIRAIAAIILSIGLSCSTVLFLPRVGFEERRQQGWLVSCLSVFMVFCLAVDFSRGQILLVHPDSQTGYFHLLRSPVGTVVVAEWKQWEASHSPHVSRVSQIAGASSIFPSLRLSASELALNHPNIVLVLVESWGQALSIDMNESVTLPYRDSNLRAMYQVSSGTVPFKGATIAGETRELCGSTLGFGVITASASRFQDCLPAKLVRSGYQTTAVHGFSGRMFQRVNWYQRAQFHEVWFREQLEAQKLPICLGPFPGICDAAVSHWIGDRLQQNGSTPQFIYWVTLNSHLPVPVPNGVEAAPACSEIRDAKDDRAICSWFQLIYNVHRSILNLAMRPMSRPTVFVIVGDHAPPFSSPELRARFSPEVVPYIILQPKKAIDAPGPSDRPVMLAAHSKGKPSRKKDGLVGLAESF